MMFLIGFHCADDKKAEEKKEPVTKETTTIIFANDQQLASAFETVFGDGATSLEQSPVHLYNTPGTYDVILIIDNNELKDTLKKKSTSSPPLSCPAMMVGK